jgi:hypothetical protein
VFKVFDKENTGEININQVLELINKFDSNSSPQFRNINLNPVDRGCSNGSQPLTANSSGFHTNHKVGSQKTKPEGSNNGFMNGAKKITQMGQQNSELLRVNNSASSHNGNLQGSP